MSAEQLSAAEVKNMPADEVAKALRGGRLDDLIAGRDPGRPSEA